MVSGVASISKSRAGSGVGALVCGPISERVRLEVSTSGVLLASLPSTLDFYTPNPQSSLRLKLIFRLSQLAPQQKRSPVTSSHESIKNVKLVIRLATFASLSVILSANVIDGNATRV